MQRVVTIIGGLLVGALTLLLVFVLGMRAHSPAVLTAIRRFNRAVFNPRQLRSAGAPGAYASVVRHTGRTSGRAYATPVVANPTDDGFVIALPYGTQADWLKNVLAHGSATIVDDGGTYPVDRPEVVPMEVVASAFSQADQRTHRIFGVDRALRVRRAPPTGAAPVAAGDDGGPARA